MPAEAFYHMPKGLLAYPLQGSAVHLADGRGFAYTAGGVEITGHYEVYPPLYRILYLEESAPIWRAAEVGRG